MYGKTQKGQVRGDMVMTLVVVAVALTIGVFVFATIFPALSNSDITNDTYTGTAASTQSIRFPPVAPDAIGSVVVENCTTSSYASCTTMNTSNYTVSADGNSITFDEQIEFAALAYTSGRLPTGAQASTTAVSTNTFTAFTLAAVVLIVIAAAAIIRNLGLFG